MTRPVRIQRKRAKGWKMPENTVYVGRPTKWGNPYVAGSYGVQSRHHAVECFERLLRDGNPEDYPLEDEITAQLRGKNLACWCPLDQPCHADVLLEIANRE